MSETADNLEKLVKRGYEHGFITDIESDSLPPGLDEDVVRAISLKKREPAFLTAWRLKALRQRCGKSCPGRPLTFAPH